MLLIKGLMHWELATCSAGRGRKKKLRTLRSDILGVSVKYRYVVALVLYFMYQQKGNRQVFGCGLSCGQ